MSDIKGVVDIFAFVVLGLDLICCLGLLVAMALFFIGELRD